MWVPCSRVSHVYRGHSCSSCHSGGVAKKWGDIPLSLRNYKRLVETWYDPKYKEYFYTTQPLARFLDMGDISEQLALKKKKNCKSFDWFMKEIAYDVFYKYPAPPPNAHWGEIRNLATSLCVDSYYRQPPSRVEASGCHSSGGSQLFRLNTEGQLTSGEWCVVFESSSNNREHELSLSRCTDGDVTGPWVFSKSDGLFRHKLRDMCLVMNQHTLKLNLAICQKKNRFHLWQFNNVKPHWARN